MPNLSNRPAALHLSGRSSWPMGVLFHKSVKYARSATLSQCRQWLYRHPLLHGIACEIRSSIHRIGLLWKTQPWRYPVDLGRAFEKLPSGHLVRSSRTACRISDTQKLLSSYPWASSVDLQFFLAGWDRGCESALGSPDSYSEYTDVRTSTLTPRLTDFPSVELPQEP